MITMQMQKIKKPVSIPKKQQIKTKIRIKTFSQNISEKLMINYLKNTVTIKFLTVL